MDLEVHIFTLWNGFDDYHYPLNMGSWILSSFLVTKYSMEKFINTFSVKKLEGRVESRAGQGLLQMPRVQQEVEIWITQNTFVSKN